ncbi:MULTISPECIES: DUF1841 family protein [Legionella]|uniref:DUF1841 domain-containing protein n=1 Tax=Legionella maceachernii TaxID=466 RepID=A0A0W0VWU5_9GAMM|nr:DUF1841 family protein [Legionella maceachernii]KTD24604.1 hypothetical protein Lmac_2691 [Legionella maceachernii]SKA25338.1 protein of unknown function [Legionella maceachernii]SUO99405.1 Domain of uncharacterised function (DUF1841) [Legionella maceachernii]
MFYGNNVQDTRQMFFSSWKKYRQKQSLQPLEQQLVAVIIDHPEYQAMLESPGEQYDQTYFPELGQTNPFLHMGLHLAIREQVATDRPQGISQVYTHLLKKYSDSLVVEHLMMDSLAECLWEAQRENRVPDEKKYLLALNRLLD